jgi:hypothetical protein
MMMMRRRADFKDKFVSRAQQSFRVHLNQLQASWGVERRKLELALKVKDQWQ